MTRRTRLANERTYLAWWRTDLTTFAVSLAAGKLVSELSSGTAWPFDLAATRNISDAHWVCVPRHWLLPAFSRAGYASARGRGRRGRRGGRCRIAADPRRARS
jgi:hypothetical protein